MQAGQHQLSDQVLGGALGSTTLSSFLDRRSSRRAGCVGATRVTGAFLELEIIRNAIMNSSTISNFET